ncbi:MAG: hypothetical protein WBF17_05285 [Phycisphaerae bacterium]
MNEKPSERQLLRAALGIREQLQGIRYTRTQTLGRHTGQLTSALTQLDALRRKLHLAYVRGWNAAAGRIAERIARTISDLPYYLRNVEQGVAALEVTIPSARDLLADLRQLKEEFPSVSYGPQDGALTVAIEPVELEGLFLGEFEIHLDTTSLGDDQPNSAYRVVALDPQPAVSNSSVTHPHVSDERLCAGDATTPIRAALSTGRICDFFMIVRSVLTTYNGSSPYVSVEDWLGTACYDCGCTVNNDETNWCSSCEHDFCSDCSSCCRRCDDTTCLGCLDDCPVCSESVCPSCLTRCPECNEPICHDCLAENLCPCYEEDEDDQNEQRQPETTVVAAGDCPGQSPGLFDVVGQAAAATRSEVAIAPAS